MMPVHGVYGIQYTGEIQDISLIHGHFLRDIRTSFSLFQKSILNGHLTVHTRNI